VSVATESRIARAAGRPLFERSSRLHSRGQQIPLAELPTMVAKIATRTHRAFIPPPFLFPYVSDHCLWTKKQACGRSSCPAAQTLRGYRLNDAINSTWVDQRNWPIGLIRSSR
jgi:hypothetical protein